MMINEATWQPMDEAPEGDYEGTRGPVIEARYPNGDTALVAYQYADCYLLGDDDVAVWDGWQKVNYRDEFGSVCLENIFNPPKPLGWRQVDQSAWERHKGQWHDE